MSEYRFAVTRLKNALSNKRKPAISYKENNLVTNMYKRLNDYVRGKYEAKPSSFINLDEFDEYKGLIDNYDSTSLESQLVDLPEDTAVGYSTSLLGAVNHLRNEAPRRSIQTLLGPKELPVNDFQKSEFLRRVKVVDDPIETVVNGLENKNLTNVELDTLQAVYPQTYQIMKDSIIDILSKTKGDLDANKEQMLRKVMDLPQVDSTTQQNFNIEQASEKVDIDATTSMSVGTKQATGKLGD